MLDMGISLRGKDLCLVTKVTHCHGAASASRHGKACDFELQCLANGSTSGTHRARASRAVKSKR